MKKGGIKGKEQTKSRIRIICDWRASGERGGEKEVEGKRVREIARLDNEDRKNTRTGRLRKEEE